MPSDGDDEEDTSVFSEMLGLLTSPFHGGMMCRLVFRVMALVGIGVTAVWGGHHLWQFYNEPLEWKITHERNESIMMPAIEICPPPEGDLQFYYSMTWDSFHIGEVRSSDGSSDPSLRDDWCEVRYFPGDEDKWYEMDPFIYRLGGHYENGELIEVVRLNTTTKCVTVNDDPGGWRLSPLVEDFSEVNVEVPFYYDPPGPVNIVYLTLYEPGTDPYSSGITSILSLDSEFLGGVSVESTKEFAASEPHLTYKLTGNAVPDVQWSKIGGRYVGADYHGVALYIWLQSLVIVKSTEEAITRR